MNCYFADSFYYLALLNPHDAYHERAGRIAPTLVGSHCWTTEAVLLEVADALSTPAARDVAAIYIRGLQRSPDVTILPLTPDLFERGLALFEQRGDKEWSLTDCISFVVMQEQGLTDALTADHHFEQAGFRALLREEIAT